MSPCRPKGAAKHKTSLIIMLTLAAGLTGCTIQPLYSSSPGDSTLSNEFKGKIAFNAPSSRLEQTVRDTVIFRLSGGGSSAASNPVLRADIKSTSKTSSRFRLANTSAGQTSAAVATVTGTVTLRDPKTAEIVATYSRSAIAPFDRSSTQDFANERAELDAEQRAAKEVGEQLAVLIAARLRNTQ